MKLKNKKLWTAAILLALTGAAASAWPDSGSTGGAQQFETARVTRGDLQETVLATGVIRPKVGAEINVGSRISGTVIDLVVDIGDRVQKGQLLAELDDTALLASVDQLKANIELVKPRIALAEATLNRQRQLVEGGWATAADIEISERDLAVAHAQLDVYLAQVRSAEITLGYTRINAPMGGTVANVTTREGETVAAGFSAPTFVTIVDLENLEVLAYVDETDIGRVYNGQIANFSVDTYPDKMFEAQVTSIQPKAELQNNVVNYIVRLAFTGDEDFTLRPEMTAHVQLVLQQKQNILTVPRRALKRENGRQFVLVNRDGVWDEQVVEIGWRTDSSIEITAGLSDDDIVALNVR
jgi:macrolide-specific efflux system membrane fusion protein